MSTEPEINTVLNLYKRKYSELHAIYSEQLATLVTMERTPGVSEFQMKEKRQLLEAVHSLMTTANSTLNFLNKEIQAAFVKGSDFQKQEQQREQNSEHPEDIRQRSVERARELWPELY